MRERQSRWKKCRHCEVDIEKAGTASSQWMDHDGHTVCPQSTYHEPQKDPKRVRAGKKSKTKGKVFERRIVNLLRESGFEADRGWWQAMGGGRVPDVTLDGFWLECGDGEQMDPLVKLRQAEAYIAEEADKRGHLIAVSITKRNRTAIQVMLRAGSFFRLNCLQPEQAFFDLHNADLPVTLDWVSFVNMAMCYQQRIKKLAEPPSRFVEA